MATPSSTPSTAPSTPAAVEAKGSPPAEITTPDKVETRLGTLEFADGAPALATVETIYDNLDFTHALNVFLGCFRGASTFALREGFRSVGAGSGDVLLFSTLMDSQSLFLTANCDTVYALTALDLGKGPIVVETPPLALGAVNDMWFQWVIDLGLPGPDRGAGGKYLLVPPGYTGVLPEGGYHVAHARTRWVIAFLRFFLEADDPAPVVQNIKKHLKITPYAPGAFGTSVASILAGAVGLSALVPPPAPPPTRFIEVSGRAFNTIPASDHRFFDQVNAIVQEDPATAFDAELGGAMAAIGIVKGQPFKPDARMRKILDDAAAIGNATGRTLCFRFREKWAYYPRSAWQNMLFEGGYTFETPPPLPAKGGMQPFPPTGARTLDSRTAFFYAYTGVTPGMIMRLPELGSQYLMAFTDAHKEYFDGARSYRLTLPPGIPAKAFWSLTLYDNQTRSMLRTPQTFPRAGSQGYPTPAATPGSTGETVIHIGPEKPADVAAGNWVQSMPGKGWFAILRLYGPLPAFFDKSWRPSELEETPTLS